MSNWGPVREWAHRRGSAAVVAVGACALAVTMLSVGGAWALMSGERPGDEVVSEPDVETVTIPAILTSDSALGTHDGATGSIDRLLGESRTRSVETIEAGEVVYAAAGPSADLLVLHRLRGAIDQAAAGLDDDLPDHASTARRERRLAELAAQRTSILDAASVITEVRRVPAEELPAGTTTTTEPVVDPTSGPPDAPTADPTTDPTREPTDGPTPGPSADPTADPDTPTSDPSGEPSGEPTGTPSPEPTGDPTTDPTTDPTQDPGGTPTDTPAAKGSGGLLPGDPVLPPSDAPTD
ncbi:hypothetical protein GCM10028784_19490 [Myceligenerans cantabricum]